MVAVQLLETLALLAAALIAVRRARPAAPPYGRRLAWIGFLLLVQLGVLGAFVAFQSRTLWGAGAGQSMGPAFVTQTLRAFLLLAAASAWLGIVRPEIRRPWHWALGVICVLAMIWGQGSAPGSGAIVLGFALHRMKWLEQLSGWRRAVAFAASAVLLVLVSFMPIVTIANGASHGVFSTTAPVWPPPLLLGQLSPSAAGELALIRPLDHAIRGLLDLLRVQLLVVAIKMVFLPVRLQGMSLKRRFTVNYILVRTVPTFVTAIMLAGLAYLALGYIRMGRIRAAFDATLARSGVVARFLAEDPAASRGGPGAERMAAAIRWLGPDCTNAHVAAWPDTVSGGAFGGRAEAAGLAVLNDSLVLAARRPLPGAGALEVIVPLDSAYLARVMRPIGGELAIRARPNLFVGSAGIRISDSTWTRREVIAATGEPRDGRRREPRWYFGQWYLTVGDWSRTSGEAFVGAVEMDLTTTFTGLLRSLIASPGGLFNNIIATLGILLAFGILFSVVDGIAVRSGRSIVQAVVDEATTLQAAAERFGSGQLDYRLPPGGLDEFGVVASSLNRMAENLARQREELKAAERVEEDLAVARQIQQRFLPQRAPDVPGLDVAGVSQPSREVGGDLFDWFAYPDGALGFALGDVSGKSVPAAMLMSNVLASLRAHAMLRVELAESLGRVNHLIADQIEPGRFVTLFYAEIDLARETLRYVSAGHNPPLLLRANGDVEWLRDGGLPLGVMAGAEYSASRVALGPGDALVVYSDGVTECEAPVSSASGAAPMFGEERLIDVVRAARGAAAAAMIDAVLASVHAFAADRPPSDDVTLVVVRRT